MDGADDVLTQSGTGTIKFTGSDTWTNDGTFELRMVFLDYTKVRLKPSMFSTSLKSCFWIRDHGLASYSPPMISYRYIFLLWHSGRNGSELDGYFDGLSVRISSHS